MKRVLFSSEDVINMARAWQKYHHTDDMDDYSHGIVDGLEFVLFLMERCEE